MWYVKFTNTGSNPVKKKKEMKKYIYFFFFNDTATTEIYTLSLHDALPISAESAAKCNKCHEAHTSSVRTLLKTGLKDKSIEE